MNLTCPMHISIIGYCGRYISLKTMMTIVTYVAHTDLLLSRNFYFLRKSHNCRSYQSFEVMLTIMLIPSKLLFSCSFVAPISYFFFTLYKTCTTSRRNRAVIVTVVHIIAIFRILHKKANFIFYSMTRDTVMKQNHEKYASIHIYITQSFSKHPIGREKHTKENNRLTKTAIKFLYSFVTLR